VTRMCDECTAVRAAPARRTYCLQCLYCGARYLQRLRTAPRVRSGTETNAERDAWRKKVLDDWEGYGHNRARMRELALGTEIPVEPLEPPKK
jgi:hypothetical protein